MERTIGPWRVLDTLGVGGMGVVYRAMRENGGTAAVKTTRQAGPEESARIRLESRALSTMRHAGIVRYIEQGSHAGEPWYAMELLEGRTLRAFMDSLWPRDADTPPGPYDPVNGQTPTLLPAAGERPISADTWTGEAIPADTLVPAALPMSVSEALSAPQRGTVANGQLSTVLSLFLAMCEALTAMHRRGLVHRDLKPENVFLRHDGTPVLMDLGLVTQSRGGIGREKLEEGGRILGTLPYMAPEQAEGAVVDARADIYSLGAMLYETLTGHRTIRRGNLQDILAQIRHEVPPAPSTWVEGVSPELDTLIMRMLAKSPRDRVGHADDVAAVLAPVGATAQNQPPTDGLAYLYRPSLRGRESARESLAQHIALLRLGQGGAVVISGESGAGKTFLAIEAATLAGKLRVGLVTGECLPMDADGDSVVDVIGAPLHPFRKFLEGCADRSRQRGAAYSRELLGPNAQILAPFEPTLASTPAFAAFPPPEPVAAELARERVISAMRSTLAAWGKVEGPTVVLLDDLQWTDELTFSVLRGLDADFFAANPILLVCTWRSDEIGPAHRQFAEQAHVAQVSLARLDRAAVAEMVADMLAISAAPADLVDFLTKETEGNPFFVAEYLRMAVAEGLLLRERGKWTLAAGGEVAKLPSPGSLTGLVSRRLSGLSPQATRVIEVAAVLGRHVRETTLLGALTASEADEALAELEARQILEAEGSGWRFIDDKLREAAFVRVPAERRVTLHAAAAAALEAERGTVSDDAFEWGALAYHWTEAKQPARAVVAFARAGDQALRNFSNREAGEAYADALALADATGVSALDRARWEGGMADACLLSGETKEGMAHGANALAHAGFPLPTSQFGWMIGFFGQFMARVTQAYWLAPFAVRAPTDQTRLGIASHISNRLLEPYFLANLPLQGLYVALRCINLGERIPPNGALARGLGFTSMLVGATPLRKVADRWVTRALELAEEHCDEQDVVYVLNRSSCYDVAMGRWDTVFAKAVRARDLALKIGDRRGFEEAHTVWAQALDAAGRVVEAGAVSSTLIDAASKRNDRETQAMGLVLSMDGLVRRGRATDALGAYQKALPEMHFHGEGIQAYFHGIAAEATLQLGDLRGARALADQARALLEKTPPAAYFALPTLVSCAHVYLAAHERDGDPASLHGAVAMHKWLAQQAGLYPYVGPARDRIGGEIEIRRGKRTKGERLLRAAVEHARTLSMDIERAQAHAALARHGDGATKEESVTAAAHLFDTTGARDWHAALL